MNSIRLASLVTRARPLGHCLVSIGSSGGTQMTDRQPSEVTNLDRYGNAVLPWSRPHDLLSSGPKGPLAGFFLGTVRPDGRPHAAGIGAVWHDGDLYFTSGP